MALVFKLVRSTTELSLISSTVDGWHLVQGWQPGVLIADSDLSRTITERMPFTVVGISQDTLSLNLAVMHRMQRWADEYRQGRDTEPVWLYSQAEDEPAARRAVIHAIEIKFENSWYDAEMAAYHIACVLTITRGPWESATAYELANMQYASNSGLTRTYNYVSTEGAVPGDLPARWEYGELFVNSSTTKLDKFWLGLRTSEKHPSYQYFAPVWELEAGTVGGNAGKVANSEASPGSGITCVEVQNNSGWEVAVTIALKDVVSSYFFAQAGKFLDLLRARADGDWRVYLQYGYAGLPEGYWISGEPVDIYRSYSGVWKVYEMGISELPLRNLFAIPAAMSGLDRENSYQIRVLVKRFSDSGSLYLDALIRIPVDEGLMVISRSSLSVSSTVYVGVGCSPLGAWGGHCYVIGDSQSVMAVPIVQAHDFVIPPTDGMIVVTAAQEGNISQLYQLDSLRTQAMKVRPRWGSFIWQPG